MAIVVVVVLLPGALLPEVELLDAGAFADVDGFDDEHAPATTRQRMIATGPSFLIDGA